MFESYELGWSRWMIVLNILLLLYGIILGVYRLTIHPLAGFPGPKLTAVSKWYEAYYDLLVAPGGQFANRVKQMHLEYGPIVRINPNEISIRDADFHEAIHAPQPAVRDKFGPFAAIVGTTSGAFSTVDHHIHRKRRAANSAFFSGHNITLAQPLILKYVEQLCELLRSKPNEIHHLRALFMALKLDIFYEFGFADKLGLLEQPGLAHHWDETFQAISYCGPFVKMFSGISLFANKLPISLVETISPEFARVLALNERIKQQAAQFEADPEHFSFDQKADKRPETLFQALRQSNLSPPEKSAWRVAQEGVEMFSAAGSTAPVMSAAIFHLHDRSETLRLLREELDEVFPGPRAIPPIHVLENLPYLGAVIRESLRMGAPVATRLPMLARSPLNYQQWTIPAGTPISVNSRDLLHYPEIFPEPYTFKPERWLVKGEKAIPERYFVPFSKGARMCQGRDFAMNELQVTIAVLIRRFEFQLVDTTWERDVKIVRDCFVAETTPGSEGVKVRVVRERQ